MKPSHGAVFVLAAALAVAQGCGASDGDEKSPTSPLAAIPGHDGVGVDGRRTQGPRTMTPENYLQSYMTLFGTSSAAETLALAKGADKNEMFETWNDHLGALGLPDYGEDIARAPDTNPLMLGAYERLGMALCERAAERDLAAGAPPSERKLFDFVPASDPLDRAAFDTGFDVLHRTILGYPAKLAPGRPDAFFRLYSGVVGRHGQPDITSRLSPAAAGWAVVCEGLVRHPEFHLY